MSTVMVLTPTAAARQLHRITGVHPTEWLRTGSPERLEHLTDLLLDIAAEDEERGRQTARLYRIAQGEPTAPPTVANVPALRIAERSTGARLISTASVPASGQVLISPRGHWRRTDDARLDTGDAVCRGCGYADSWQHIDRRVGCPAPATTTQIRAALAGAPLREFEAELLATHQAADSTPEQLARSAA
jgi:hypothetical protein